MNSRSQDRIILQLKVLVTEVGQVLIVTLYMKGRKEDKEVYCLHSYQQTDTVVRDLVKGGILLGQCTTLTIGGNL
jgi:archaellum biogenesis protein FlaJ (TadC family)